MGNGGFEPSKSLAPKASALDHAGLIPLFWWDRLDLNQ